MMALPLFAFPQTGYNVYFGNLHSHTGNSDGEGTPTDAYNYAKNTAALDFLAVTDHLEQIDPLEWFYIKNDANSLTTSSFVAIAGWEWGSPLHGHVNVFNTDDYITDVGNLWYTLDLPAFYNWVRNNNPAFAQFNHPGDVDLATNWNDFEYIDNATDNVFHLIEFQTVQQATDYYEFSLNQGWHLSPAWNQDNHSADWGTKNDGRAGIWATSLTKADLFSAIDAGRTFATMDKNASLWLDISGIAMGGTAQRYYDAPVHIRLSDNDNEIWSTVELVSQNGIIQTFSSTSGIIDTIINYSPTADNYIFIRAIQSDGNYLWSAPVYFNGVISGMNSYENELFSFYPSPATEKISISFFSTDIEPLTISLYDIKGSFIKVLYSGTSIQGNNKFDCTLENISSGMYFMKLQNGKDLANRKIIIIK